MKKNLLLYLFLLVVTTAFAQSEDDKFRFVFHIDKDSVCIPAVLVDSVDFEPSDMREIYNTMAKPDTVHVTDTIHVTDIVHVTDTVVKTDTVFVENKEKKIVIGWGDSLTAGAGGLPTTYLTVLQDLMGPEYEMVNGGIGGETSNTISARQGGTPMTFTSDVTLMKGKSQEVTLVNIFGDEVQPLLQGGDEMINPCRINGALCKLAWTGNMYGKMGKYTITLLSDTTNVFIRKNTPIITNWMLKYRQPYCNIVWVGQNDDYKEEVDELVRKMNRMIDYTNTERYLVVGLHTSNHKNHNAPLAKIYGDKFINWFDYSKTDEAFEDAGIEKTRDDVKDIENNVCPRSFMVDPYHLNATGYASLGRFIYRRMKQLGY